MKLNAHTALITPTVTLLPYSPHHVPKYHTWMQSPTLRALTASEPLTLAQEHAMQQSWRNDGDKLTFVICTPDSMQEQTQCSKDVKEQEPPQAQRVHEENREQDSPERDGSKRSTTTKQEAEIKTMIGDVNIFFYQQEDEDEAEAEADTTTTNPPSLTAELEIMIADPAHRGKGIAPAALKAILHYLHSNLDALMQEYHAFSSSSSSSSSLSSSTPPSHPQTKSTPTPTLTRLGVKIAADNPASLRLFERLGFARVGDGAPNYFGEVEMRMGMRALGALVKGMEWGVREVEYGL